MIACLVKQVMHCSTLQTAMGPQKCQGLICGRAGALLRITYSSGVAGEHGSGTSPVCHVTPSFARLDLDFDKERYFQLSVMRHISSDAADISDAVMLRTALLVQYFNRKLAPEFLTSKMHSRNAQVCQHLRKMTCLGFF